VLYSRPIHYATDAAAAAWVLSICGWGRQVNKALFIIVCLHRESKNRTLDFCPELCQ